MTIAEQWLHRIDKPERMNRTTIRRMKDAAVNELQEASPMRTEVFVFADGSGLYEKRQDDWFPLAAVAVTALSKGVSLPLNAHS